jgi:predicted ester cyclase
MIAVNNKKLVQDYWEAISGKAKTPQLSERYVSDPELMQHIAFFEAVFPKYELLADDFICEDDKVVVRARFKGVHQGNQLGIPATGKTVELPFAIIYQVKEGKICKNWMFLDQMEMMTQLGVNANDN